MTSKTGKIITITVFLLLFWLLIYSYSPRKYTSEVAISAVTNKVCDLQQFGDINCDGKINLADFEIWRKGFFQYNLNPTIVPSSIPSSFPTCIPRPPCLDATPACLLPEPIDGWCPPVTPSPTPSARPTIIPSVTPICMWCGTNCVRYNSDIACPMVMPPENMKCEYIDSACRIGQEASVSANIR